MSYETLVVEACAWFHLDLAHLPFPFADFSLYPFPVISYSHEYNYAESC